jgi:hypothetical protein
MLSIYLVRVKRKITMKNPKNPEAPLYQPSKDFLRVATATPEVAIADVTTNLLRIEALYDQAVEKQTSLVVFAEL